MTMIVVTTGSNNNGRRNEKPKIKKFGYLILHYILVWRPHYLYNYYIFSLLLFVFSLFLHAIYFRMIIFLSLFNTLENCWCFFYPLYFLFGFIFGDTSMYMFYIPKPLLSFRRWIFTRDNRIFGHWWRCGTFLPSIFLIIVNQMWHNCSLYKISPSIRQIARVLFPVWQPNLI